MTLKEEYEEKRDLIRTNWKAAQASCEHKETDYEYDPSGNGGLYYCKECGKADSSIYILTGRKE
jgi:hypothetical protein